MITLEVNVFEHSASRTASLFTSRIRRILTTLHDGNNGNSQNGNQSYRIFNIHMLKIEL